MPSHNRLWLAACAGLAGIAGGRYAEARWLPNPIPAETPQDAYPRNYPQPDPQIDGRRAGSENRSAPVRDPDAIAAARNTDKPPKTGDADAGPPPAAGPSGTSGMGADRYDEVGYATWYGKELAGSRTASGERFDPAGFTGAHRTLSLGSYVEVTALDTGRTILVQINDRGPAGQGLLIDLSQAGARALGIADRAAVRIRRVNPSPGDLTALRSGQPGTPRLDAPPSLLIALRQRLPGAPGPLPPKTTEKPAPAPPTAAAAKAGEPVAEPKAQPAPPVRAEARGTYFVQVAALSSKARALQLAKSLGGSVSAAGPVWRVRLGPYPGTRQAAQARDGAARRGYGDARIIRED